MSAERSGPLPPVAGALLLVVLIVVPYLPSLRAGFVWDDADCILHSERIRSLDAVPRLFLAGHTEIFRGPGDGVDNLEHYWPLLLAQLAVTYSVDGPNPQLFHLASLVWHLLCALGVYALARRWLKRRWWAEGAVLLFAWHPVPASAVLFVSSVSALMATFALLVTLLLLDRSSLDLGSPSVWVASGVFFLGLLAKETPLLVLPVLVLWLVLLRKRPWQTMIPLLGSAGLYLILRGLALGGMRATGTGAEQLAVALHNGLILLGDGLRALVLLGPRGLRHLGFEYAGLGWGFALFGGSVVAALAFGVWRRREDAPLGVLAIGVYLCAVAPVGLVTTVFAWGGFGRYFYLPWAFLAVALAAILENFLSSRTPPQTTLLRGAQGLAAAFLLAQVLLLQSAQRDWQSNESLALSQIRNAPLEAVGHEWLGEARITQERYPEALALFAKATDLDPSYHPALHNRSLWSTHLGRPEEGLKYSLELEASKGRGPGSSYVRGLALLALGRAAESAEVALWALARGPANRDLQHLLAEGIDAHADPAVLGDRLRKLAATEAYRGSAGVLDGVLAGRSQPGVSAEPVAAGSESVGSTLGPSERSTGSP